MKNLSLSDLIERRQKIKDGIDIEIPALDGKIHANKLSAKRVASILSKAESEDMETQLDAFCDIIYASCPVLQKKELQDAYGVKVPEDIVLEVFDQRIDTLASVAGEIMNQYVGEQKEIKN